MNKVVIDFPNKLAAEHFSDWLCGQGEQDYWLWMAYREEEHEGDEPITARRFGYPRDVNEDGDIVISADCYKGQG